LATILKDLRKKSDPENELKIMKERAMEIHSERIVIDGHTGSMFDLKNQIRSFGERSDTGHVDLPRLREGGVDCSFLSAFATDRNVPIRGVREGLVSADIWHSLGDISGVRLARKVADIEEARENQELAVMLNLEGGDLIEGSVGVLRMFYKLGVRMLTLAWNDRNLLADGVAYSMTRGGLTSLGVEVLKEAAELGILIDVSHLSEAGFWDVVDETEVPFVASHSNCYELFSHPRNLTNDQLRAVAGSGGLVAISCNPEYLAAEGERPSVSTVADHIIHAVNIAGEEHVAIGTDFDSYQGEGPQGLPHIGELPELTVELLKRGLPGRAIYSILGSNWLRVFRAVIG
jgi:membrane dipeptidase